MHLIRTAAAVIALAVVPAAALAATPAAAADHTYRLTTVEAEQYGAGVVDGRLRLTVRPDGIIQGSYQTEDYGTPHTVTGGVDPDGAVWLEIGNDANPRRYVGTFRDGVLHTTLLDPHAGDIVHFDAAAQ